MFEVNLMKSVAVPRSRRMKRFAVVGGYFGVILLVTLAFFQMGLSESQEERTQKRRKETAESSIAGFQKSLENLREARNLNDKDADDLRKMVTPMRERPFFVVIMNEVFAVIRQRHTTLHVDKKPGGIGITKVQFDGTPTAADANVTDESRSTIVISGWYQRPAGQTANPVRMCKDEMRTIEKLLLQSEPFKKYALVDDARLITAEEPSPGKGPFVQNWRLKITPKSALYLRVQ